MASPGPVPSTIQPPLAVGTALIVRNSGFGYCLEPGKIEPG